MDGPAVSSTFAEIARVLLAEPDVQHTLQRTVGLAVQTIDGCDFAGVSLVRSRTVIETPAYTDDLVRRGDELQYQLSEGPCLDAIWQQATVRSDDLATESRWPRWGPAVSKGLGFASTLSFQLFVAADTLGALNLYSRQPRAFDDDAVAVGLVFASHAAIALSGAQTHEGLLTAVATRTEIGRAEGILMERYRLSAQQAFEVLRRASQETNVRLRDVAAELTRTGRTPGVEPVTPAPSD